MNKSKTIVREYNLKGMVCNRCIKVLRIELSAIGAEILDIQLGHVAIRYNFEELPKQIIENVFISNDFEIIPNGESVLSEEIKRKIHEYIWELKFLDDPAQSISDYLSRELHMNYSKLSRVFSTANDFTIERFVIMVKIEKAKALIEGSRMNFNEIAFQLGYNNLSALSKQFKIETDMTMSDYNNQKDWDRRSFDKIG